MKNLLLFLCVLIIAALVLHEYRQAHSQPAESSESGQPTARAEPSTPPPPFGPAAPAVSPRKPALTSQQQLAAAYSGSLPTGAGPSDAFLTDVGYSQQAAIAKYPQLAVRGSRMNQQFIARWNQWKVRQDPRLGYSNWPEKLADEIARQSTAQ